jgi:hypothetical protein
MSGTTHLLVGTTKGAFILTASSDRTEWDVSGPHCDGWPINHMTGDPDDGTIWAGGGGDWTARASGGPPMAARPGRFRKLSSGQMDEWAANDADFAAMIGWEDAPAPFGDTLHSVWSLHHAHGRLHAGTKPAEFLTSTDGGVTWEANDGARRVSGSRGLVPRRSGPDAPYAGLRSRRPIETLARDLRGGRFRFRGRGQELGASQSPVECRGLRPSRSPRRTAGRRDRPLRAQHGPRAHNARRVRDALSAEPPRHVAQPRWRAHLGRYRRGLPSTFGFPIAVHPMTRTRSGSCP